MPRIIDFIDGKGVRTSELTHLRMITPRAGDVVDFWKSSEENHVRYGRIEYVNSEDGYIAFCREMGSAFWQDADRVAISGGPFSSCPLDGLEPTLEFRNTVLWNWGDRLPGEDQAVEYIVPRPVFRLKPR